ncbi:MAG: ClbS/DfsB family four-helix bundle protein [Chloroflexi bacterium]|nr:ClbS/DfsB family four-helix bundle protein [Chloroflexota bacterium]
MNERKTALLKELDDARAYLNETLARLDADAEIYPGWKKREFIAHIAGWEAMCYEAFRDYRAGAPRRSYPFADTDAANEYFVAIRQSLPLQDVTVEYEINRFVIRQFLKDIPLEEYDQPVTFVWWQETVEQFVHGAVKHEMDHAADIRAL